MPRVANNANAVNNQVKMETDTAGGDQNGSPVNGGKPKPAWLSKIQAGGVKKVPKDVQKRRRNFRLGRLVAPKPPMAALQEVIRPEEISFGAFISDPLSRLWKISATYDNQKFEGVGPTKNIAKNICSENVLQYISFKACEKDSSGDMNRGSQGEEHKPWTALASVALFKMFNDWQAQGAVIPPDLMKTAAQSVAPMEEEKPKAVKTKPEKKLPEDPTSRHPVQLLHEMLGPMQFEFTQDGLPPNVLYTCTVTVNDVVYSGAAKNKKEAKKECAKDIMLKVYNVSYVKEEAMTS
eukprot:TRINITY_DN4889_c0_g1_i4.p1 TRINITY_DN4889_c0_g1~~TRINITY_DN4889_c0_g1_i4.p1  ORF type:complete len:294 (-),score=74.79 TRINITY_DN4889_c0_g1_i4:795-1676(-)